MFRDAAGISDKTVSLPDPAVNSGARDSLASELGRDSKTVSRLQ